MFSLKRANNFICVSLFILILASILLVPCEGQVTFSRDWTAGKRALDSPECRYNIKSATAICHILVNEIRQLAGCEARAEEDSTNTQSMFSGKR